jgi:hypothetical protein
VLRLVVQLTALVAAILGLGVIMSMPIGGGWRGITCLLWLLFCRHELKLIRGAYARFERIRIECSGAVELFTFDGQRHAAAILPGSVLLPRCAWLRFELEDGCKFGELLRGDSSKNKQWRHLQVIWRHLGAAA